VNPRPYRSPGRTAAAEQTRKRIVAAASELLRSPQGIIGFSLEAVAKAAGVTRLTVYNQFGSRRALLEAVFDDRAAQGGLHRLADAMADPEPTAGLRRLVAIFCEFWNFDRDALARLHGVGLLDAEFAESVQARNERRRQSLSVLVGRMVAIGEVREQALTDLTDVLFTLTSFHVYAGLTATNRSAEAACALIQELAADAVARAAVQSMD
jgi:AcrR family transcriptional regulator